MLQETHYVLALGLILFGGIPHGATDYVISRHLKGSIWGSRKLIRFLFRYLLIMALYAMVWWASPVIGLLIFLGISVLHFGQSNWNYLTFHSSFERQFTYYLWGALVLFFPIIWHFETALPIIESLTGAWNMAPGAELQVLLCTVLTVANAGWIIYLYLSGQLQLQQVRDEAINLAVLLWAFTQLPLLLGFAVYFVAWHSLSSILDQIRFYNEQSEKKYDWRAYLRDVWPFSLLAIGTVSGWLAWRYTQQAGIDWGGLFIFISVVTLPHMILIDRLYAEEDLDKKDAEKDMQQKRLVDKKMIKTF
jgi:Brp/Blh family beta-carotene 15,15'-monooxygenase